MLAQRRRQLANMAAIVNQILTNSNYICIAEKFTPNKACFSFIV